MSEVHELKVKHVAVPITVGPMHISSFFAAYYDLQHTRFRSPRYHRKPGQFGRRAMEIINYMLDGEIAL